MNLKENPPDFLYQRLQKGHSGHEKSRSLRENVASAGDIPTIGIPHEKPARPSHSREI
jgi:hypothetical protein